MPDAHGPSSAYPIEDFDFYSMPFGTFYHPLSTKKEGLWAQMIKSSSIFGEVPNLHTKLADKRFVLHDI
jgi:hypothetical protein